MKLKFIRNLFRKKYWFVLTDIKNSYQCYSDDPNIIDLIAPITIKCNCPCAAKIHDDDYDDFFTCDNCKFVEKTIYGEAICCHKNLWHKEIERVKACKRCRNDIYLCGPKAKWFKQNKRRNNNEWRN